MSDVITEQMLQQELANKADLDLSNSPVPHVIESYESDSSWYRVYSDGWCEQGGQFGEAQAAYVHRTFNFLKPFKDINYCAFCQSSNSGDLTYPAIANKDLNSVTFNNTYNYFGIGNWFACGYVDLGD